MNKIFHTPAPSASLDIDILRSVIAIAESGSIAAAATRVARTPAAVSMQIKKLEEMLGRTLFERTRKGMTTTADGDKFLEYARRMVELNRAALDAFSMPEMSGTVRLAFIDSFSGLRMAEVLASFARQHPKVIVNATMGCSAMLAPALDERAFDLALLTPGCAVELRETDLVLHEEPLVWIAKEDGKALKQRPIPVSVADRGCAWRKLALESLTNSQLETRIAYASNYDHAQLAAVHADLAIAPMPRSYLAPGLVELGARDGVPPLGTALVVLRMGDAPNQAARALAARVAETYGKNLPDEL